MFPPPALPWSGLTRECRIAREPDFCLKRCPAGVPGTVRRLPGRDRLPIFPPGSVLLARFLPERGRGYPPGVGISSVVAWLPGLFPARRGNPSEPYPGKIRMPDAVFPAWSGRCPGRKHAAGRSGMNEAPPSLPPGIFHWAGSGRRKEEKGMPIEERKKRRA